MACERGDLYYVKRIVEQEPRVVNAREPGTGNTALQAAASSGHCGVVVYLMYKGANVTTKDPKRAAPGTDTLHHKGPAIDGDDMEVLVSMLSNTSSAVDIIIIIIIIIISTFILLIPIPCLHVALQLGFFGESPGDSCPYHFVMHTGVVERFRRPTTPAS